MEAKTICFKHPDKNKTKAVFSIVSQRVREPGIKTLAAASTTDAAVAKAMNALKGLKVAAIAHHSGRREANAQKFTTENRKTVRGNYL